MARTAKEKTSAWVRIIDTGAGRMGLAASERGLILSTLPGWADQHVGGPDGEVPPGGERVPAGRPRWSSVRGRAADRRTRTPSAVNRCLDLAEKGLTAYYSHWPECPGDIILSLWEDLLVIPVDLGGLTTFTRKVLQGLRQVPPGQVISYGALAARAGSPKAARAVGAVMARNPVPIILPCHRVVARDGTLGGFSGGKREDALALKSRLLRYEGWTLPEGRLPASAGL